MAKSKKVKPAENSAAENPSKESKSTKTESEKVTVLGEDISTFRGLNLFENVVNALFFIFLGSVLLLNTTGFVPWTVWLFFIRFWPIFLIFAGIRIILGKSLVARIIMLVVSILVFGFIFLAGIVATAPSFLERFNITVPVNVQEFIERVWTNNLEEAESTFVVPKDESELLDKLKLSIDVGYGEFILYDNYEGEDIFKVESQYCEGIGEPYTKYTVTGGLLDIDFNAKKYSNNVFNYCDIFYDMAIEEEGLLADLDITVGAGKGSINFTKQSVNNIKADVGAGELIVKISKDSEIEGLIDLKVGAGKVEVLLDPGVSVKVNYKVGVGDIEIFGKSYGNIGSDGTFTSENYNSAGKQIEITVEVGVGSFELSQN
ncbi:hypothetical protein JW962_00860 [Candidatus Dojkabacteria bacterium]|nr:hypothetical protein [Candidatus Dojkabacteria bacterium]